VSRHFVRSTFDRVVFSLGGMTAFGFGTIACVVRLTTSTSGAQYPSLVGTDASGDDAIGLFLDGDNSGRPSSYNGTGGAVCGAAGQSVASTDNWCLVAWTKATGTVAPTLHTYKWDTNAWLHTASGTTTPDAALTVTGIKVGQNHLNNEGGDMDIAAAMMCPSYVMTNAEIERLPAGRWSRYVDAGGPGFLCEFAAHDQPIAGAGRDSSRSQAKESSFLLTSRGASLPPGFRYSRLARRR
jgi:hypothetical protein